MGYMGIGLNKWVYKQRPRKFFSKERKPIGDTIPKHEIQSVYTNDNPQLTGRLNEHTSKEQIDEERYTRLSNKVYRIIIYSAILVFTIFVIVNFNKNKESKQAAAQARFEMLKAREKRIIEKGHQLIYDYGMNNLEKKDYKSAIKEFEHLVHVQPQSIKAKEALANALYLFCINDSKECERALTHYQQLTRLQKKNNYLKRSADIYIHLGLFAKSDSILDSIK